MNQIKAKGTNIPWPIFSWYHSGFPLKVYETLEQIGLKEPFPIQCQSIPVILSRRDSILIAETGSGKTLAYLLPTL